MFKGFVMVDVFMWENKDKNKRIVYNARTRMYELHVKNNLVWDCYPMTKAQLLRKLQE